MAHETPQDAQGMIHGLGGVGIRTYRPKHTTTPKKVPLRWGSKLDLFIIICIIHNVMV